MGESIMDILSQILTFLSDIAPSVIPLIAVYFGWKLSSYNERRKLSLEDLDNRFEAFRQIKEVVDNIPRVNTAEELEIRMKNEP